MKNNDNYMKTNVYDFESAPPPKITKEMLAAKARERTLKRQMRVLVIGSFLMMIAVIMLAVFLFRYSKAAAIAMAAFSVYILFGGIMIVYIFLYRGGELLNDRRF